MKTYCKFMIYKDTLEDGTEKAFPLEIDNGRWSGKGNYHIWVARSLCEMVSEPNEVGWAEVLIPYWVFTKNQVYEMLSVRDVSFQGFVKK